MRRELMAVISSNHCHLFYRRSEMLYVRSLGNYWSATSVGAIYVDYGYSNAIPHRLFHRSWNARKSHHGTPGGRLLLYRSDKKLIRSPWVLYWMGYAMVANRGTNQKNNPSRILRFTNTWSFLYIVRGRVHLYNHHLKLDDRRIVQNCIKYKNCFKI